ncbi:MAG: phosphoglucosamine mutase [Acidobacteria bacterium]|nr:MAG: phosphoglucosamine mutase [Acidobacteriota bacterium]
MAPADKTRLFGTDGIRAPFGSYPLDRATVQALGFRLGERLAGEATSPSIVLGGDTRDSTEEICSWLAAGLGQAGAVVHYGGVLPTPAIAYLVRELGADAGIAVSASHNLHPDNGIKLFSSKGGKWNAADESELEALLHQPTALDEQPKTELVVGTELADRYLASLTGHRSESRPLSGLRVALDTANGAATPFAGEVFRQLGAEVTTLFDQPDGRNINAGCGSTHPEQLAQTVVAKGCDLGIAFDGDADRAIFVDERGEIQDGDALLYLWAVGLAAAGELEPVKIVATTMSNLGLELALERHGIGIVRCGVGDRTVVETMKREGIQLGGEQSGHIVNAGLTTTGDGLVTAIEVSTIISRGARPFSELLADLERLPQVLQNVKVARKPPLEGLPRVAAAARQIEDRLGDRGRLLLRYSGTEPLARVMIEGSELAEIEAMAAELIGVIQQELGEG